MVKSAIFCDLWSLFSRSAKNCFSAVITQNCRVECFMISSTQKLVTDFSADNKHLGHGNDKSFCLFYSRIWMTKSYYTIHISLCVGWHESVQLYCGYYLTNVLLLTNYWVSLPSLLIPAFSCVLWPISGLTYVTVHFFSSPHTSYRPTFSLSCVIINTQIGDLLEIKKRDKFKWIEAELKTFVKGSVLKFRWNVKIMKAI